MIINEKTENVNRNIDGTLEYNGNLKCLEDLVFEEKIIIKGDLNCEGDLNCKGNLDCKCYLDCKGNLDCKGYLYCKGNLDCKGKIKIKNIETKKFLNIVINKYYKIQILDTHIKIGCQFHSVEEWENFTDDKIIKMDGKKAIKFWKEWKDILIMMCNKENETVAE